MYIEYTDVRYHNILYENILYPDILYPNININVLNTTRSILATMRNMSERYIEIVLGSTYLMIAIMYLMIAEIALALAYLMIAIMYWLKVLSKAGIIRTWIGLARPPRLG